MPLREERCVPDRELERLEIGLLLEGVYRRTGVDFRDFEPGFVLARVRRLVREEGAGGVTALLGRVLRDRDCRDRLLAALSTRPSPLFGAPGFFRAFRAKVVPLLRTYPSVRIWQVGCATGEEAFSLAILLEEEGIPGKVRIYATEPSGVIPEDVRSGLLPARSRSASERYARSGGRRSLEDYLDTSRGRTVFRPSLRRRVVFAPHCLATDGPFNEFQAVVFRSGGELLGGTLRARFHELVHQSLARLGFLGLGRGDGWASSPYRSCYAPVAPRVGIYRKVKE